MPKTFSNQPEYPPRHWGRCLPARGTRVRVSFLSVFSFQPVFVVIPARVRDADKVKPPLPHGQTCVLFLRKNVQMIAEYSESTSSTEKTKSG